MFRDLKKLDVVLRVLEFDLVGVLNLLDAIPLLEQLVVTVSN